MAGIDVSVIVPCHNVERLLDQALASAERNDRCALEIITLNDGSTDGSLAIMRAHEAADARVRVIDKRNEGYGATVNRGISEARGDYVAILEPDDWVEPHMYDELLELADIYGRPDVVKSSYWRVLTDADGGWHREHAHLRGRVHVRRQPFTLADAPQLIQYHPSVWSALYARAFLDEHGIRLVEAAGAGWVDNPFTVSALAQAGGIVFTDRAFYCYREDLPGASSAAVTATLMARRWCERQDVLDDLGIHDEGILRANCIVGLRFLARMLAGGMLDDATSKDAALRMARRMDPDVVARVDCVSPGVVRECLRLAGRDAHSPLRVAYGAHLAREAWRALAHNGGIPALARGAALLRERGGRTNRPDEG